MKAYMVKLTLYILNILTVDIIFCFSEKSDSEIEEVSRSHNVPTDILHLKAGTDRGSDRGSDSPTAAAEALHEWAVCSTLALPRGSSFGPYKGSVVVRGKEEEGMQTRLLQVRI